MTAQIKLLVVDFDGTVLGGHEPYDQFPAEFVAFLDELNNEGIQWMSNTTWGIDGQFSLIKRSGVRVMPVFLTGGTSRELGTVRNGSLVHDVEYENTIIAREKEFRLEIWPEARKIFLELLKGNLVDRISFSFYDQNMIVYSCREGNDDKVWRILKPLLDSGKYYAWNPETKESNTLLPYFFNKAEVLKVVQARLNVGPENTIVAGDGTNDLHMLDKSLAEYMVCPANGNELVKKVVRDAGGIVSDKSFSWGVIDGVRKILENNGGFRGRI